MKGSVCSVYVLWRIIAMPDNNNLDLCRTDDSPPSKTDHQMRITPIISPKIIAIVYHSSQIFLIINKQNLVHVRYITIPGSTLEIDCDTFQKHITRVCIDVVGAKIHHPK